MQVTIDGSFTGFDGDTLVKLTDGTFWLQDEYKYWYHYAYCPNAEIFRDGARLRLRLVGQSESVAIRQVHGVIEARIAGAFEGWQGESEYELTNGQVWKQRKYRYEYKYKYRPQVLVYDAPSGKVMDVEGSRAIVERVK